MKTRICLLFVGAFLLISSLAFSQQTNKAENLYQEALMQMEGRGNFSKALELFGQIIKDFPGNRQISARSQYQIGVCYEKLGKSEAQKAYERVIKDFADQREVVTEARSRLLALENASQSKKVPELSVRQVWTGPGVDIDGGISQDGRYLSFIDWSTGDLAARDMSTGTIRRLTNKGSWSSRESADFSTVSPDGKRVAYAWLDESGNCSLRLVGIDGSEPRILYRGTGEYLLPEAWSQDGTEILAVLWGKEAGTNITLISTIDSSLRVLKSFDRGSPGKMAFSPDGRWIAYDHAQDGNVQGHDISLLASDGTRQVRLIEHPANDVSPVWAPDGKSILFASDRGGAPGFWLISVLDGKVQGSPRLVKPDIGDVRPFSITSNGTLYYGLSVGGDDVYTADIDPTSGKLLSAPVAISSRFVGFNSTPACSPDGQFLAYISSRGRNQSFWAPGNRVLVIRSLKTGEDRECLVNFGLGFELSWAPNSRSLMVVGKDSLPTPHLFQVDTKTSESKVLVDRVWTTSEGHAAKGWFPDGKSIYFVGITGKDKEGRMGRAIARHYLASGEKKKIFTWRPDEFDLRFATLSPDGKQFAAWWRNLRTDSLGIVLIPAGSSELRELLQVKEETPPEMDRIASGLSWTPDGRYVLFARRTQANEKMDLWRVDVTGGKTEKLGSLSHKMHDLVVHPDGKRIFFSARENRSDVWVMENFLPKQVRENKEFSIRKVGDVGVFGAISPDGRYLSYVDWDTGDLAFYEIATGKKRRLTNKGSWDQSDEFAQYSRWSPDSRQIVYDWLNKSGNFDLCIVGLDGSKPRILYSNKESIWAQTFDWSPDGKQILANLEKKDGQNQIVLVSAADGSVRVLKIMEQGWPDHMNFSPDGRYIAYDFPQKGDSPERDISILSTDGGREIQLVQHPSNDYVLGWSPDGENILFASDRRNSLDAWVIQFSDGKVQGTPGLVKSNMGQVNPMGFAQKGSFYYGIYDRSYDVYFAELDLETGKMLALPRKPDTRFEGLLNQPEYSPDGKYIAYVSVSAGHSALSIQSLDTAKMREFPLRNIQRVYLPRWSPDGRSILVGGWDLKGKHGIYRIDTQSGIFTLMVPSTPADEGWATAHELTRDGKAVFLARNANHPPYQTRIVRREIESGIEKELYRGSPGMFSLSCSPDGQWLAFMRRGKEGFLGIMPVAGGEHRELYRFKQEDLNFVPLRWTPDGKYLLFEIIQPGQKKWSLLRIPMEGGEPQKVGLEWDQRFSASVHPDGRHIVFSTQGPQSENSGNWVMENFLPKEVPEIK